MPVLTWQIVPPNNCRIIALWCRVECVLAAHRSLERKRILVCCFFVCEGLYFSWLTFLDKMRPSKMAAEGGLMSVFLHLTMTVSFAHTSGATCLESDVEACRKAAFNGDLATYPGGGTCEPNSYVHYTHECKVGEYEKMPSIDFCCCAFQQKVMCCRYHQNWDRFRCAEADDTIDTM